MLGMEVCLFFFLYSFWVPRLDEEASFEGGIHENTREKMSVWYMTWKANSVQHASISTPETSKMPLPSTP